MARKISNVRELEAPPPPEPGRLTASEAPDQPEISDAAMGRFFHELSQRQLLTDGLNGVTLALVPGPLKQKFREGALAAIHAIKGTV